MAVVYGLLGLLTILLLVLFVPVCGRVRYDGQLCVRLRVWGIPITLLPASPEEKEETKASRPKSKKKKASSKKEELVALFCEDGVEGTLRLLGRLAALAGRTVGRVLRAVTVDKLELELLIAAEDAADTAVRYGQVCGVLYPALAAISGLVRVKRQHLRVEPNFLVEKSDARLDVRLHIAVYRLVAAGLWLLWRLLFLKISEENKEVMHHGE